MISGCGGGGDSSAAAPAGPSSTKISGVAADGPLQGASACYDLNDNGACDAGEPTSTTDANGNFSFDVANPQAGQHRVVVDVPATAIDKDTGAAVGTGFTLMSPATGSAAQAVFASPLTTLVQAHIDATGATLSAASDHIKTQAGLTVSPLADFTAAANADNKQAANVARLIVLTTQQQNSALASVVGQIDVSGSAITAADLKKAVTQAIITALPGVAAAAADPAVANASGAALQAALAAAAQTVVAQTGLTAETAAATVGVAKLPPDASSDTPVAGALLTALRYTDANNWFFRSLELSAADSTPDANNQVRYYSVFKESVSSGFSPNGVVSAWGTGNTRQRAGDLHWNGSAWVGCALGTRSTSTKRDALGRNSYEFCDKTEEGNSTRSAVDLSGKSIATVFRDVIRQFPNGANGVNYADWGPADLAAFGSATFPTGSQLYYQTNTVTKAAFAYDVQATNVVSAVSVAVAAGGDTRSTAGLACAGATPSSEVTTLDDLVARNPGRPCIFAKGTNANGSSLDSNEWWSNSTTSLGTLAGAAVRPPGTGTWYTTNLNLRVAFAASGNAVTYYSCLQNNGTNSSRNCTAIGTGTYTIQTVGDARVLSFSAQPALTQRQGYVRVFVERGGKVYFGFTSLPGSASYLRLNLAATNAVFAPLGLPPIAPVTRASDFSAANAAAATTLKGAWGSADSTSAIVFRFGDSGRFLLGEAAPEQLSTREQSGAELGYFAFDAATGKFASLLEVDSNLTSGTSHPGPNSGLTVTATQLTTADGSVFNRLAESTGIVGLWAVGSVTDFAAPHIAFFTNGKVMLIDSKGDTSPGPCLTARQGPPGAEFASYTFNATTGALRVFGKIYDTNGCAGLFDSSAGAIQSGTANTEANGTVVFAADGKSATVDFGDGPATVYRIPSQ